MEINDQVIDDLANVLTSDKLNEAMLKTQNMMEQVKTILREVTDKNPEASREEILALAKAELDQKMNEMQAPTVEETENGRDDD